MDDRMTVVDLGRRMSVVAVGRRMAVDVDDAHVPETVGSSACERPSSCRAGGAHASGLGAYEGRSHWIARGLLRGLLAPTRRAVLLVLLVLVVLALLVLVQLVLLALLVLVLVLVQY